MTTIGRSSCWKAFLRHEARLRHRAFGGIDEKEHAVGHRQHALNLAAEIRVTGRVDQVDLRLLPRGVGEDDGAVLRQDRDAAFAFQRIGIE
jgi:hypothetical protein